MLWILFILIEISEQNVYKYSDVLIGLKLNSWRIQRSCIERYTKFLSDIISCLHVDVTVKYLQLLLLHIVGVCVCVCLCVCVGEWIRRQWSSTENIHWRQAGTWSLITGQWRSRVGHWLVQWSHSTAEQWTTTTTCPLWHKLSSQAVVARTIMLRWTHVTTVRCTPQRRSTAVVRLVHHAWGHLIVSSAISTDSSLVTSLTSASLEHCWDSLFNTERHGNKH